MIKLVAGVRTKSSLASINYYEVKYKLIYETHLKINEVFTNDRFIIYVVVVVEQCSKRTGV